jgi:tripartite-type tricarboxylate transporter receptor subunit TctC
MHMKILTTILMTLGLSTTAVIAQEFPSQTVTIVVPYSPSGSADPVARYIAGELQEKWGQSVIIDNRPGAGSTIGTAYVSQAPADGYTILLTTSAYTTAPAVYDDLPYDPLAMVPVAMPSKSQFVITVGSQVKATTVEELVEESKSRDLFLATAGLGSSTHFAGELFTAATGTKVEPVHYKGGSEAMVDLMGGRADIYAGSMTAVLGSVKGGQIRALAVMGDERGGALPDVPSTEELGITGASSGFWLGVFAPAGTPDDIVQKLNKDIVAVLSDEDGKAFLARLDSTGVAISPTEFEELVTSEIEQWKKLAKERGISAE